MTIRHRIAAAVTGLGLLLAVPSQAAVTLTKSVMRVGGGTTVCPGDSLDYTVCIQNVGPRVNVVLFQDMLPALCFASATFTMVPPAASDCTSTVNGAPRLCLTGWDLNANSTTCVTYRAVLKTTVPSGAACVNQAQIIAGFSPDPVMSNTVTTRICGITFTKVGTPVPAREGQPLNYTFAVNNSGANAETNALIVDDIPDNAGRNGNVVFPTAQTVAITYMSSGAPIPGATFNHIPPPAGNFGNGIFEVRIPSIPGGETALVNWRVDLKKTCAGTRWGFSNQARLTTDRITSAQLSDNDDGDPTYPEPTASGNIQSTGTSNVMVEKLQAEIGPPPLLPGDRIRYTVRFTDTGGCPLADARVVDDLPMGVTLVVGSVQVPPGAANASQAAPAGANMAGQVNVSLITTPGGGSADVVFEGVVQNLASCSQVCNTAGYGWPNTNLMPAGPVCMTVADPGAGGQLTVTKDGGPDPVRVGDIATWSVVIANGVQNPCAVSGATFSDDLASRGLTLVPGSVMIIPAGGGTDASTAGQILVRNIALPAQGGQVRIQFATTVLNTAANPLCNRGSFDSGGSATPSNEKCLTLEVSIPCPAPPAVVTELKAVRSGTGRNDVDFSWLAALNADKYNGYRVRSDATAVNKSSAGNANGSTIGANGIEVTPGCGAVVGLTCTDPAVVTAAPALFYYQMIGLCADGTTEGPN